MNLSFLVDNLIEATKPEPLKPRRNLKIVSHYCLRCHKNPKLVEADGRLRSLCRNCYNDDDARERYRRKIKEIAGFNIRTNFDNE